MVYIDDDRDDPLPHINGMVLWLRLLTVHKSVFHVLAQRETHFKISLSSNPRKMYPKKCPAPFWQMCFFPSQIHLGKDLTPAIEFKQITRFCLQKSFILSGKTLLQCRLMFSSLNVLVIILITTSITVGCFYFSAVYELLLINDQERTRHSPGTINNLLHSCSHHHHSPMNHQDHLVAFLATQTITRNHHPHHHDGAGECLGPSQRHAAVVGGTLRAHGRRRSTKRPMGKPRRGTWGPTGNRNQWASTVRLFEEGSG